MRTIIFIVSAYSALTGGNGNGFLFRGPAAMIASYSQGYTADQAVLRGNGGVEYLYQPVSGVYGFAR